MKFFQENLVMPVALEKAADRFASSVFSVLIFLICVVACVMGIVGGMVVLLSVFLRWLFPDLHILAVVYGGLFVAVLPGLCSVLIDSWLKKKPERLESNPRLAKWGYRLMKFNYFWIAQHLYGSIPLTFQSHWSSRKVSIGFGLVTFALAGIFIFGFLVQAGFFGWNSYKYLPSPRSEATLATDHYEDRRDPESRARVPVIESEIVEGTYLRLFIPFRPSSDNDLPEWACPDLVPVHDGGIFLAPRAESRSEDMDFAPLRTCLSRVWTVKIDGTRRNTDYVFYRHPRRKTAGVLAQIPMRRLNPGRHELMVRKGLPMVPGGEEPSEDAPSEEVHRIVFWR